MSARIDTVQMGVDLPRDRVNHDPTPGSAHGGI